MGFTLSMNTNPLVNRFAEPGEMIRVGLLINFNVQVLRHGIRRVLHPELPRVLAELKRTK